MRVIKFRAWDAIGKVMYYDGNLNNGDVMVMDISGGLQFSSDGTWKERDFNLMQFTGRHDKQGKEIYDGDIVTWNCSGIIMGVVYWGDGGWQVKDLRGGNVTRLTHASTINVIGNIYESPELLEKN